MALKPQMMQIKHDPENRTYGDCFRAAIASLLEIKTEHVPHVFEDERCVTDGDLAINTMNGWLSKYHGVVFIELPAVGNFSGVSELSKRYFRDQHYLLLGESANGCNHNVVCRNGEIVHDPSPDNSGIVGPCGDGFYWIGFLVKVT